jgi:hypothetical protein
MKVKTVPVIEVLMKKVAFLEEEVKILKELINKKQKL